MKKSIYNSSNKVLIIVFSSFQIVSDQWIYLFCGVGTKVMHTTTDNIAYILFFSDYSIVKVGFNITFTAIEGMKEFEQSCKYLSHTCVL